MARGTGLIGNALQGTLGKEVVFKKYGKKTVITRYPDMSKVEPSKAQISKRKRFAEAVLYAKNILQTPTLYEFYKEKAGKKKSVYHYAIKEYMKRAA